MDGIETSSRETVAASKLGVSTRDERPRSRDARSVLAVAMQASHMPVEKRANLATPSPFDTWFGLAI